MSQKIVISYLKLNKVIRKKYEKNVVIGYGCCFVMLCSDCAA